MRAALLALWLPLLACGSSTSTTDGGKVGTPVPGEGVLCPTGSTTSCQSPLLCASYSGLQSATGVCRTPCSSGCSNGETCGSDSTCQCTPTLTKGSAGDACAPNGLICHPDFGVCAVAEPAGTTCPTGEVYSPLWTLCLLE
jgi:hypothetical protein